MNESDARRLLRIEEKLDKISWCIGFALMAIIAGVVFWASIHSWHLSDEAAGWVSLGVVLVAGFVLRRMFESD